VLGRLWQEIKRSTAIFGVCMTLSLALLGCSQPTDLSKAETPITIAVGSKPQLEEVSPPESIQQLRSELEQYRPQVKISGLASNETVEDTQVSIQVQVKDLPLYKDAKLGLGPHINVFLDDQHYQDLYDVSEPLTFQNLSPGTHTIRAIAVRPWEESYKTAGAYDQVTFQIFAPTQSNRPDPAQPLLTLNSPHQAYSAEPVLLDYYVTLPASKTGQTSIAPWKVKVSLDSTSFTTDGESPLYLKGFKPGKNWLKLELIDQNDRPINSAFSETLSVVTIKPSQDPLSQLLQGQLVAQDARRIVDRTVSKRLAEEDLERQQEAAAAKRDAERSQFPLETTPRKPANQDLSATSPSPKDSASKLKGLEGVRTPEAEPRSLEASPTASFAPRLDSAIQKVEQAKTSRDKARTSSEQSASSWSQLKNRFFSRQAAQPSSPQPTAAKVGADELASPEIKSSSSASTEPPLIEAAESKPDAAAKTESESSVQPKLSDTAETREPLESLQKFLDFEPVDPEKLPIIRQETAKLPSGYFNKLQKLDEPVDLNQATD
jgi:hypothetical protein